MKKTSNSTVFDIALSAVLNGNQFVNSRVCELMRYANLESFEDKIRTMLYITGQLDFPEIPQFKMLSNTPAMFTSYNIFSDQVHYEYDAVDYRCFSDQEEADIYTKTGNYDYQSSKSSKKPTEEYPIVAEWHHKSTATCSLDYWQRADDCEPQRDLTK